MAKLRWIASYPKSGNTWLRLLLASLKQGGAEPEINRIDSVSAVSADRAVFDNLTALTSSCLPDPVVEALQPGAFRTMAGEAAEDVYLKCHDAFRRLESGDWLFPADATGPSVYLVRDPRDVAVSYAHHNGRRVGWAVAALARADHRIAAERDPPSPQLPQTIGGWSAHVESWMAAPIPLIAVRYEDLIAAPRDEVRRIARHLGLAADDALVDRAVEACDFQRMKRQERDGGFVEASGDATPFFRRGAAGDWANHLTQVQADRIAADHEPVMRRFGYL